MAGREDGFFDRLQRPHDPWLRKIEGTIRFDVSDEGGAQTRHWTLAIREGAVEVTPKWAPADSVVHADAETLDRMSRGEMRLLPAWLRNEITVEGRLFLALVLERLWRTGRDVQPTGGSPVQVR